MRRFPISVRRTFSLALLAALPLASASPALAAKAYTPQQEQSAGEEATKEILAETPEWTNEEQRARCQAILDALVPHSERPDVKYTVRLLDTDDVNAFSLPGGIVFVTRGLVQPTADPDLAQLAIQSDHELAGILAHEMAHNCHYDGLESAERSADVMKGGMAAALLVLLMGGGTSGMFTTLSAGMNIGRGIMSHYSMEYESNADRAAVDYLAKSTYDANGLLTFIERLAARERSRLRQELGVLQTHPYSSERVQAIKRAMAAHGIDLNPRAVTNWSRAEPMDAMVHGKPAAVVMLWDQTICTLFDTAPTGETPAQRAQAAADALNDALSKGAASYDIGVESGEAGPSLTVLGQRVVTVLPGDVEAPATTTEVAEEAAGSLRAAMWGDNLHRTFKTGS